jgi:hypothetical protein
MTRQLQINEKSTYQHAIVTGGITKGNVTGYLTNLVAKVASNRGVPIVLFPTVAVAEAWFATRPR